MAYMNVGDLLINWDLDRDSCCVRNVVLESPVVNMDMLTMHTKSKLTVMILNSDTVHFQKFLNKLGKFPNIVKSS